MKRVNRIFLMMLAVALLLPSCVKDNIQQSDEPVIEEPDISGPDDEDDDDPLDDEQDKQDDDPEPEPEVPRVREGQMPAIYIECRTAYDRIDRDNYSDGTIRITDLDGWYSDRKDTTLVMQIRGRGQSSWGQPKKPYKIKLADKTKMYGMPGNRDWVLIANYNDKSLLRNTLGYKVSEICGMAWTPLVRACDLYWNGTFKGSYLLAQHKEIAGQKVNIDPETGYYIEVETNGNDYRTPNLRIPIIFKDPEWREMNSTRQSYIKNYLNDWESAVSSDNFTKVYEMMDMDSFVNFFIIEELAKNIDGNFRKSTFMTKEKDKKLVLYHIWDFDIAFGNCDYMHTEFRPDSNGIYGNDPTGFFVKVVDEQKKGSGLFQHLFKDPSFVAAVKARWQEVYPALAELPQWLREEARINRDSYDRNFRTWRILGTYVWPNPSPIPRDYDGELDNLVNFYTQRVEWMNSEISKW